MLIPTFFTKNISRVESNKNFSLPLILNTNKDIELVFFGYSGCSDICTPRLYSLNEIYSTLDEDVKEKVGVVFLDISIPKDRELPQRFAKFFNKEFRGVYLDANSLRSYTKVFGIYFAKSLTKDKEYEHTANLYLVKKTDAKKEIRYIYNAHPYDIEQIKEDIGRLSYE
ncbi:MAG: SCO family protein [Sulfurimonas sp.]|nr:SCO family protein [Sulfurimonas sp.]